MWGVCACAGRGLAQGISSEVGVPEVGMPGAGDCSGSICWPTGSSSTRHMPPWQSRALGSPEHTPFVAALLRGSVACGCVSTQCTQQSTTHPCVRVCVSPLTCRPCFEQVVQQLEELASHLDELKQQQAQAMAAAAAPLFHPLHGAQHDSEPGHELTPSMMAELMPSGFGPSSAPSDIEEAQGSGVLYEMSQLSGGSHDQRVAMHLGLASDEEGFDADAGGESPDVVAVSLSCSGEVGVGSIVGSRSSGSKHGARLAVVR